jgi:hypothetical protein
MRAFNHAAGTSGLLKPALSQYVVTFPGVPSFALVAGKPPTIAEEVMVAVRDQSLGGSVTVVPLPVKATVKLGFVAFDAMVNVALLAPTVVGVKVTFTVQLAPPFNVAQLFVCVN